MLVKTCSSGSALAGGASTAAGDRLIIVEDGVDDLAIHRKGVSDHDGTVTKILEGLSPNEEEDVRTIDVPRAVRRYNNKHPGVLSPRSLAEYQRRVQALIGEFEKYHADPTSYAGIGREVNGTPKKSAEKKAKPRRRREAEPAGEPTRTREEAPRMAAISLDFPLRTDFLAQVVVPRDLKAEEARRLCAFVMTLAADYEPKNV